MPAPLVKAGNRPEWKFKPRPGMSTMPKLATLRFVGFWKPRNVHSMLSPTCVDILFGRLMNCSGATGGVVAVVGVVVIVTAGVVVGGCTGGREVMVAGVVPDAGVVAEGVVVTLTGVVVTLGVVVAPVGVVV